MKKMSIIVSVSFPYEEDHADASLEVNEALREMQETLEYLGYSVKFLEASIDE